MIRMNYVQFAKGPDSQFKPYVIIKETYVVDVFVNFIAIDVNFVSMFPYMF